MKLHVLSIHNATNATQDRDMLIGQIADGKILVGVCDDLKGKQ